MNPTPPAPSPALPAERELIAGDIRLLSKRDLQLRVAELLESEERYVELFTNAQQEMERLRAAIKLLNQELDLYWNGARNETQIKAICAAQQVCLAALERGGKEG